MAGVPALGVGPGDLKSNSGVCERSLGAARSIDPVFYPDNGEGAVARARFARNRSCRPGWMAWSERRSSIACPSRLGWASSDIVASKARDGSSSVRRGASAAASPGSSSSTQAGNHSRVISGSKSFSKTTRHAVRSAQCGKFAASIPRSNTSGARWHRANHDSMVSASRPAATPRRPGRLDTAREGARGLQTDTGSDAMRMQIVSDLHLEFGNPVPGLAAGVDVVVLAGDLAEIRHPWLLAEAVQAWEGAEHILYVPGNHEYYGSDIDEGRQILAGQCRILEFVDSILYWCWKQSEEEISAGRRRRREGAKSFDDTERV